MIPRGIGILAQFIATALIWGSSFLFIAEAVQGLSPVQVVLGRVCIGAVVLLAVCAATRARFPREPRIWAHLSVVALLLCVIPFLLYSWAGQFIDSGLASIYNATTPLMTMLVALVALREERLSTPRLIGLLLGFAGVVVVLGPWHGFTGENAVAAQAACLGATLSYGIAFVYLRRFVTPLGLPAVPVATMQVGIAAVVMILVAPFTALTPVTLTAPVVLSMLALGALGTGLAYVWNTNVVTAWGATNASTVTYLSPVVGVALGALVRGEAITWNEPVGCAIIVAGIVCSRRSPRRAVAAVG